MITKKNLMYLLKKIRELFLWPEIGFATLSLLPILISAWLFNNLLFLKVGLITMPLFIAANRLKYNFAIVTLHFFLILLGFTLLFISIKYTPLLFVLLCALMAFGCILLARTGYKLRTFGNYTFIPSVYLACELQYGLQQDWFVIYCQFLEITLIAWLTLAILFFFFKKSLFSNNRINNQKRIITVKKNNFIIFPDKGIPLKNWLPQGISIFVGVFISALLAVVLHIDNPEWLIWSTASVISTELILSRTKFLHRFLGATLGITFGLLLSHFLPHTELIYSLAILGIMLTLTSFKNYFLGFSSRCFFITIAAYAISNSEHIAWMRIQNVFTGGIIGLGSLYLTYYLLKGLTQHERD